MICAWSCWTVGNESDRVDADLRRVVRENSLMGLDIESWAERVENGSDRVVIDYQCGNRYLHPKITFIYRWL